MNQAYIRFPNFKNKAVTLSYDDGVRQDKRLISIMKKNGLRGTFNINGGCFSDFYDGKTETGRMTLEEARELYISSGMEIAVHGYRHLALSQVDRSMAVNDIVLDRRALENAFGTIINGMAYANGAYDDRTVNMLRECGIKYGRTVESSGGFDLPSDWLRLPATCHHSDPRLMELAKKFVERSERPYWWHNQAQMFYLWGHSYEFDDNGDWCVIEEFAEYIGGRDDIWYATNGEIYDYLQACDRLIFSIDGNIVYNPTCTDVYIDMFGKNVVVPGGKTVEI